MRSFWFFIGILAVSAQSVGASCEQYLSRIQYEYQRALVGESRDPYQRLVKEFPDLGNRDEKDSLYGLETTMIELIRELPEDRDIKGFAKEFHLSEEQAQDILNYYALLFYGDARLAGDQRETFERLSELDRIFSLNDSLDPLIRRHRYYFSNLTQKSVPEMAEDLNLTEGQVRSELSQLKLSIIYAFNEPLSIFQRKNLEGILQVEDKEPLLQIAEILFKRGYAVDSIAELLGVGKQALRFFFHHDHISNRGVSWLRTVSYNGRNYFELDLLVRLKNQGLTHAEITQKLNEASGIQTAEDPEIRTEASVASKLKELGLSESHKKVFPSEIEIPPYGDLKLNGKLVSSMARLFVIDHYDKGKKWLAENLGISPSGLQEFLDREHLDREKNKNKAPYEEEGKKLVEEHIRKRTSRGEGAKNFMEVYLSRGKLLPRSKPSFKPSKEWSEEEKRERNAYQWMRKNASDPEKLKELSLEAQKAIIDQFP